MKPSSFSIESILKGILVAAFLGWNLLEGAVFENTYPLVMVHLYRYPIWRVLLLVLVVLSAEWCESLTLMIAFMIFFYVMDMEVTLEKWSKKDLGRSSV
jgi:hypothetical protein